MTTALSTAPSAYGLKGPSAAITVDNATPQGATYLRGNTVQTNGTSSKLTRDRDALLAFYNFPAEHWIHLRTTNPIESTFATVRHRTTRTKNCVSRNTFLGLAFKLVQEAEKSWRRIRGVERIDELLAGTVFKDGVPALENGNQQQQLAA